MRDLETKVLSAQNKLYKDINNQDEMILVHLSNHCEIGIKKLLKYKTIDKTIKDNIEISMEDFDHIKDILMTIQSRNYGALNDDILNGRLADKKAKTDFLNMII